ncbi:MAG: hypothetical protein ACLGH0_14170 [Thermoanaerobaculia bacterium]
MRRSLFAALILFSFPLAADSPSKTRVEILHDIHGWGAGEITGGEHGKLHTVTSKDNDGKGSLREALESNEALWIIFDKDLHITLKKPIAVKSNKTVDARGRTIRIDTNSPHGNEGCPDKHNKVSGFVIDGQKNIVLLNVVFDDDYAPLDKDCEGSDAIAITDSSDIWIHHCTFRRWADSAIDISTRDKQSSRITASWSRFERLYQANPWKVHKGSFHHNVCDEVGLRCPDVEPGNDGKSHVHAYNNYVTNWLQNGILIADESDLWDDHNILQPCDDETKHGADCKNGVYKMEGKGCIERSGGKVYGQVKDHTSHCEVSSGFKDASRKNSGNAREECEAGDECWKKLRERLMKMAGATLMWP